MATGIEASGAAKQYEFGDTLKPRHQRRRFLRAIQREGLGLPAEP